MAEHETQLTPYEIDASKVAELAKKYKDVPDANTKEGMEVIKSTLQDCRAIRKTVSDSFTAWKKKYNSAKKVGQATVDKFVEDVKAIEGPHVAAKKAVEDRKAREKEARDRAEKERIQNTLFRINEIRNMRITSIGGWTNSDEISDRILEVNDVTITEEAYAEYKGRAQEVRDETLKVLDDALTAMLSQEKTARLQAEKEKEQARIESEQSETAAKLKADMEEFERRKAEFEKSQKAPEPEPETVAEPDQSIKEHIENLSDKEFESAIEEAESFECDQKIVEPVPEPSPEPTPEEEAAQAIFDLGWFDDHATAVFILEAIKGGNIPYVTYDVNL